MKGINYIGLGTAAIGRPQYINIRQSSNQILNFEEFKQIGIATLDYAYEFGIRYFDTAPGYGMAEQLVANWLREKDVRSIEVATKWGYTYTANFDANAITHEVKEHSLNKLNEQWSVSRAMLPVLKYYQIHSATFDTNILNNMDVLNRLADLKEEHGLVVGLTTTGHNQVEVFEKALEIEKNRKRLFDLFQMTYNIFEQSIRASIQQLEKTDIKIVIKEAMANGRIFPNQNYPHYARTYQFLSELANKYNVGIDAIALRYCIDSISSFKVLSGASNIEHLRNNLKAADFELEPEDIQILKGMAINPDQYWNERKQLAWN